jgi:hypothetical protein
MFTARYGPSPFITQIRYVFKGFIYFESDRIFNVLLNWGHPVVYVKIDIGKTVEQNKNYSLLVTQYYYLLYNATSFDPIMGLSSGQEQKIGDMKCTWKCLTGSRSVYIDLYIYLYI